MPQSRANANLNCFCPSPFRMWNDLPIIVARADTAETVKPMMTSNGWMIEVQTLEKSSSALDSRVQSIHYL